MFTLALDTTTRAGSVAVVRGEVVLAVVHGDATRTHGERLPGELERALQQAGVGVHDVELLAVASGPGAFTGLRIGLATMQGLAMVLNVPVIAVSALDALAYTLHTATGAGEGIDPSAAEPEGRSVPTAGDRPHPRRSVPTAGDRPHPRGLSPAPGPVAAWMDAQRGEVFAAYYGAPHRDGLPSPDSAPLVGTPEAVLASMPHEPPATFTGDGAMRYKTQILHAARHRVVPAASALAPAIALIATGRAARGEAGPPHALQPLYVRRPDAELERQRRSETPGKSA